LASSRSLELFGKLPDDIKLVLGDHLDTEKWEEIRTSGVVPQYLLDIELNAEQGRILRGNLPNDTHLIAPLPPPVVPDEEDDHPDEVDDLLGDVVVGQLATLHDAQMLQDPTISILDVSRLYKTFTQNVQGGDTPDPDLDPAVSDILIDDTRLALEPDDDVPDLNPILPSAGPARIFPDINVENILPPGARRRRVRFDLPHSTA
jgi:hypothetical protein